MPAFINLLSHAPSGGERNQIFSLRRASGKICVMPRVSILAPALLWIPVVIALFPGARASLADADVRLVIAALDERLAAEPGNAPLFLERAEVQRRAGNWQAALVDLDRAERLNAALQVALPRARALLAGAHFLHAKAVLDEFLESHPGDSSALIERARAEARIGEDQSAVVDYRAALPLVIDRAEPDLLLEIAGHFQKAGCAGEALRMLDAALASRPGSPALVARALELEVSAGDFDRALQRVGAMIKASSRPEPWLARRASLLAQAGRFSESRSAWESLLNRLATLPEAERASHAMQMLAEQSRHALGSLRRLRTP